MDDQIQDDFWCFGEGDDDFAAKSPKSHTPQTGSKKGSSTPKTILSGQKPSSKGLSPRRIHDDIEEFPDGPISPKETQELEELKNSIKFSVGKTCEKKAKDLNVRIPKQVIHALGDFVCDALQGIAQDLEAFANHADRKTINQKDILLLTRKSPTLESNLKERIQIIQEVHGKKKESSIPKKKGPTKKAKTEVEVQLDDFSE